jgi:DNA repair exonuclease SbcCD ATPase subunit
MPPNRITPAADALIDTLDAEVEALNTLEALYDQQIKAIRANNLDAIDERTMEIQVQTATLQDLGERSERQARLLGRVLGMDTDEPSLEELVRTLREADPALSETVAQAQTTVAERAQGVNQRRETLRLALQYAADLNHELLVTMQEAASDTDGQTYTAEGQSDPGTPDRSFVDTVG